MTVSFMVGRRLASEGLACLWIGVGVLCETCPLGCLLKCSRLYLEGGKRAGLGSTDGTTLFTWVSAWWEK